MFGRILYRVLVFSLVLFSSALVASAQDLDDVIITGKLTDSNGLAVVGATVAATSVDTGITRTVTSNEDGRYRIVELKPGTYKIKVTASGFGVQETTEIETISAQNVQQDFKLAPADVRAETTVTVSR